MPEHMDGVLKPGQHFDPGPFALDLYRLLCIVLADKAVAKLSVDARGTGVAELQATYRKVETTRILVSSAVALRIMFDRYPKAFGKLPQRPCGVLYPKWPGRTRDLLSLREACNKIINASDSKDDLARHPDEEGSYVRDLSCTSMAPRRKTDGGPSYPSLNLCAGPGRHLRAACKGASTRPCAG